MKSKNKQVGFWSDFDDIIDVLSKNYEEQCEIVRQKQRKEVESFFEEGFSQSKLGLKCVEFFKNGKKTDGYMGWAECRICEKPLGSYDMLNDGWEYPERWEHYIEEHSIRPNSEEFLKFMKKKFS